MSNQEFEVGDRVRCNYGPCNSIHTIIKVDDDFVDCEDGSSLVKKEVELISKGDETMEADAIAVEVDDEDLGQLFLDKLTDFGYSPVGTSTYDGFKQNNCVLKLRKDKKLVIASLKRSISKEVFDLGENWNKVVEFLEQEDETFEINGHEVEYNSKSSSFSIGCYSSDVSELRNFIDYADSIGLSDDSILKVEDEEVTLKQAKELVEWLESQ